MSTYITERDHLDDPLMRYVMVDLTDLRERYEYLYRLYQASVKDHDDLLLSEAFTHRMFFQLLYYAMGCYDHEGFYQYGRWAMMDSDHLDDFLVDIEVATQEYFMEIYGEQYTWLSQMAFYRVPRIDDPMMVVMVTRATYDYERPEGRDVQFPWYCYRIETAPVRYGREAWSER